MYNGLKDCLCQENKMSTLTASPNVAEKELTEEEQQAWDYYEQEILKTMKKDKSVPYTAEFWDKICADVEQRLQTQRAKETV